MNSKNVKKGKAALAIFFFSFIDWQFLYGASKTSSAAFLKLPVSAEAVSLGGNAVALGNGIGNIAANPAALGFISQHEFQTSYGSHFEGYKIFNAAYGRRSDSINVGLSFTRVAADDFEGRDMQGVPTGGFGAGDAAFNVSAAKKFKNLALGMNLKYISSAIENESASAIAIDAGVVFLSGNRFSYPYKLGFSICNLGTPMKYIRKSEPLPLTASAALGVTIAGSVEAGVNVTHNLTERSLEFGAGMGLNLADSLSLTGGLSRELGAAAVSDSLPFKLNAGIGFKASNFIINYGFIPMGGLGNIQRMSMTFKFGDKGGLKEFRAKSGNYRKSSSGKSWKFFK